MATLKLFVPIDTLREYVILLLRLQCVAQIQKDSRARQTARQNLNNKNK